MDVLEERERPDNRLKLNSLVNYPQLRNHILIKSCDRKVIILLQTMQTLPPAKNVQNVVECPIAWGGAW